MTIYDLVFKLLTERPALRDSDKKLIWSVWITQGKVIGGKIMMEDYLSSEIEESITRARRMVQNDHPELKASPIVQEMRDKKEEDKGTFIYREKIDISEPLTMDHNARLEMLRRVRSELEKKGTISKKPL